MTFQPHLVQPPPIAVRLISLFALAEEAESILGDLLEEFSLLASKSGVSAARKWYWRQTIKTVPQLAGLALRRAPWMIFSTAEISIIVVAELVTALRLGFLEAAGQRAAGFAIASMRFENLLHGKAAVPFVRVYIDPSKSLIPGATCPICGRKISWSDPVSGLHKRRSKILILAALDPDLPVAMHCPVDGSFTVRAKDIFTFDMQNIERGPRFPNLQRHADEDLSIKGA